MPCTKASNRNYTTLSCWAVVIYTIHDEDDWAIDS